MSPIPDELWRRLDQWAKAHQMPGAAFVPNRWNGRRFIALLLDDQGQWIEIEVSSAGVCRTGITVSRN